jgi:NADH-ubiquinone oxidoreductase chain 5
MYLLLIFLPFLAFILTITTGNYIGKYGANLITTGSVMISCILSFIAFYKTALSHKVVSIILFTWMDIELLEIHWGFLFDSLTVSMCILVTFVSTLVHLYSIDYMANDPHTVRFMSYLSFFTFCMLMLITANNFVQLFVGWEGVGLASYLLINFWYTRIQANKAALKAIMVNRIGDFSFSLGLFTIFYIFKSFDFNIVFSISKFFFDTKLIFLNLSLDYLSIICFFLFFGAVGKSAQIGLHTWLPDAMEGPTPVSALIHAATMVTAGVFLIIRSSPLFEYSPNILLLMTFMGGLTAFMAATIGLVQNDLKKVIAYSTCSQLGYMVFACGLSQYYVSIFHLLNHGFFKALLFLSAGAIIHALNNEQDMRKMGGLINILPLTYSVMLIGSLSLMGFPFLTGFYSKDVILELAYANFSIKGHFVFWLGTISAAFTAFYSFRLIYLVFLNNTKLYKINYINAHDVSILTSIPLIILAFGSIFIGYIFKDMMIGFGTPFWGNAIFLLPKNNSNVDSEFLPSSIKLLPVIFSLIGAGLALLINRYYAKLLYKLMSIKIIYLFYSFLIKKWCFDKIYYVLVIKNLLHFGYHISFKTLDKGLFEFLGPIGLIGIFTNLSENNNKVQNGYIFNYLLIMILSIIFLILFFIVFEVEGLIINSSYYYFLFLLLFLIK